LSDYISNFSNSSKLFQRDFTIKNKIYLSSVNGQMKLIFTMMRQKKGRRIQILKRQNYKIKIFLGLFETKVTPGMVNKLL